MDDRAPVPPASRQASPAAGQPPAPSSPSPASAWRAWAGDAMAVLRKLGPTGILAAISMALPALGGAVVVATLYKVGPYLRSLGAAGVLLYISAFWVLGGLALLPTYAHSALGGWAFGFRLGLPAALASFLGASLVAYFVARRITGDRVTQLVAEHPRWQAVYDALLKRGFWRTLGIITLLRIPPNFPFATSNVLMASARTPLLPFAIGTVLGIAPRTAFVVYTAAGLKTLDLNNVRQTWMFLASLVVGAAAIVIIVAIARRAIAQVTGEGRGTNTPRA